MLSSASFAKECVEGIVATTNGLIRWHLAIWLDSMLQAKQFPTRITNLTSRLTNVDSDALPHCSESCL